MTKASPDILVICFTFPPLFSNSTGWGSWGNQEAEEVQNQLTETNSGSAPTQAATSTSQPTGCAAAGYTGCCTGDNCKTDSGCYCDTKCYYFHNCCDDITSIGCYRKCTPIPPSYLLSLHPHLPSLHPLSHPSSPTFPSPILPLLYFQSRLLSLPPFSTTPEELDTGL